MVRNQCELFNINPAVLGSPHLAPPHHRGEAGKHSPAHPASTRVKQRNKPCVFETRLLLCCSSEASSDFDLFPHLIKSPHFLFTLHMNLLRFSGSAESCVLRALSPGPHWNCCKMPANLSHIHEASVQSLAVIKCPTCIWTGPLDETLPRLHRNTKPASPSPQ